jgi:hypothetical protein
MEQPRYRFTLEDLPDMGQNPSDKVLTYQIQTQIVTDSTEIIIDALRITANGLGLPKQDAPDLI